MSERARRDCGMGTVTRVKKTGMWNIHYTANGQRMKESSGTLDRQKALAFLEQRLRETTPVPPGLRSRTVLVSDLLELARRECEALHPRSFPTFLSRVKPLLERFGSLRAEDLTTEAVVAFQAERLGAGYAAWSLGDTLRLLKRSYLIGRRAGIVQCWPVVVIDWDRARRSTRERVRKVAVRPPWKLKPKVRPPMPPTPEAVRTLEDLRALHLRDLLMNERGLEGWHCHWLHVLRIFAGREPASLRARDIEEYKTRRLEEGAARATTNNELAMLRRALNLAVELEYLPWVPKVRLLTVSNARQGFVLPEDFKKLHATLEVLDADVAAVVKLLYMIGWRRGEVLNMTWNEVDLETGTVTLPAHRNKNRTVRPVTLPEPLFKPIRDRAENRQGDFVFHRHGRPIRCFRGAWKRAAEAIGQEGIIPHDLRRSFAKNSTQALNPQAVTMGIAGHKTPSMFTRYAIIDERMMAEALERLAAFVEGTGDA